MYQALNSVFLQWGSAMVYTRSFLIYIYLYFIRVKMMFKLITKYLMCHSF